jgi:hypothetical protein
MRRTRLLAALIAIPVLLAAACGGGSDDDNGAPTSVPFSTAELGTMLVGPASLYAPSLEELPGYFTLDRGETFGLSALTFTALGPFSSAEEGDRLSAEWGYVDGYRGVFQPDGLIAGVLEGRYYVTVMVHEFKTTEGARSAFAHYKALSDSTEGSEQESVPQIGNEAGAWSAVSGTVPNTEMEAVYHRIVVRRGNILAEVRTQGGQPFMTIESAAAIATIIDERAEGVREAVEPTPIAAPTSPAF